MAAAAAATTAVPGLLEEAALASRVADALARLNGPEAVEVPSARSPDAGLSCLVRVSPCTPDVVIAAARRVRDMLPDDLMMCGTAAGVPAAAAPHCYLLASALLARYLRAPDVRAVPADLARALGLPPDASDATVTRLLVALTLWDTRAGVRDAVRLVGEALGVVTAPPVEPPSSDVTRRRPASVVVDVACRECAREASHDGRVRLSDDALAALAQHLAKRARQVESSPARPAPRRRVVPGKLALRMALRRQPRGTAPIRASIAAEATVAIGSGGASSV